MRVLVTGDRDWNDARIVKWLLTGAFHESSGLFVIEGDARGADAIASRWEPMLAPPDTDYTIDRYPAHWDSQGRAAGPIRNQRMLDAKPDVVIAFHDDLDKSKGTRDMVHRALRAGVDVYHIRRLTYKPRQQDLLKLLNEIKEM